MMKTSYTDKQVSFAYAVYMMIGSEFAKAHATNPLIEKSFELQYKEQKLNDQYLMEELLERYIQNELRPDFPEDLWEQEVRVSFIRRGNKHYQEIWFDTDRYKLRFLTEYLGGRKANILCQYRDLTRAA